MLTIEIFLIILVLAFVFIQPFQGKFSTALHTLIARLTEFSNAIRYLWPLLLVVFVYLIADKVVTKLWP